MGVMAGRAGELLARPEGVGAEPEGVSFSRETGNYVRSGEDIFMAGEAQVYCLLAQEVFMVGTMRVMAGCALSGSCWTVHDFQGLPKLQGVGMTGGTDAVVRFQAAGAA